MSELLIAKRYSSALVNLAKAENKIEEVRSGLELFLKTMQNDGRLFLWLVDEDIPVSRKEVLVNEISAALSLDHLVSKFIHVLITKRRFRYIRMIGKTFSMMADSAVGIERGELLTANRISYKEMKAELETLLSKKMNKKILLAVKEDKNVLGGIRLSLSNVIYDASIRRKLEEIKERLCQ